MGSPSDHLSLSTWIFHFFCEYPGIVAENLKCKRNFLVPISYLLEMKNSKSFQANIAVPQICHTHVALGSYNPCETFVLVRPCGLLNTTVHALILAQNHFHRFLINCYPSLLDYIPLKHDRDSFKVRIFHPPISSGQRFHFIHIIPNKCKDQPDPWPSPSQLQSIRSLKVSIFTHNLYSFYSNNSSALYE